MAILIIIIFLIGLYLGNWSGHVAEREVWKGEIEKALDNNTAYCTESCSKAMENITATCKESMRKVAGIN